MSEDCESISKRLDKLVEGFEAYKAGRMRQPCIEQCIDLITEKIATKARETDMLIENMILRLESKMKEAMELMLKKSNDTNGKTVNWVVYAIMCFIQIVGFIVMIKFLR